MAREFKVSTTGSNVTLKDLNITLNHPTVDFDLLTEYTFTELIESQDLKTAIDGGTLTAIDENSTDLTQFAEVDTDTHLDNHINNVSNPHNITADQIPTEVSGQTTQDQLDNLEADSHTHSNKTELDLITDGDHDVRDDNPHDTVASQIPTDTSGETVQSELDAITQELSEVTADLISVQARRSTSLDLTGSFVDITLDATDVENDITIIEHDNTNTDRILIKETGLYLIAIGYTVFATVTGEAELRVRVNDTTIMNSSFLSEGSASAEAGDVGSRVFTVELTSGDFLTLQVQQVSGTLSLIDDTIFSVTRLRGTKGNKGDTGAPGVGSTINLEEDGTPITNTPHETLNFADGINVSDNGDGSADIEVINIPRKLCMITGRYYDNSSTINHSSYGEADYTTANMRAMPIFIPKTITIDRIGINVTGSDSGNECRLGIYNDSNGLPGSLLLDAGNVSVGSTGLKEITISQELTKGWYWLVFQCDSSTADFTSFVDGGVEGISDMGFISGTSTTHEQYVYAENTFGSFPSTFPTVSYNDGDTPRIMLRIA